MPNFGRAKKVWEHIEGQVAYLARRRMVQNIGG
jgi:hypothetical protein